MKNLFRPFVKVSFTLFSLAVFIMAFESCSNPFNPESQFYGKWKIVSAYDFRTSSPINDSGILEFQKGGKVRVSSLSGDNVSFVSYKLDAQNQGIAYGDTLYHYEFSGNRLTMKSFPGYSIQVQFVLEKVN